MKRVLLGFLTFVLFLSVSVPTFAKSEKLVSKLGYTDGQHMILLTEVEKL
jgi:hypothetical protein